MPATEFLYQLIGIEPRKFSKEENVLIEAEIFTRICGDMEVIFEEKNKNYFRVIKFYIDKESDMRNHDLQLVDLVCTVVNDILSTKEYTIEGIAQYADLPPDVIYEASLGANKAPSLKLFRRVIELHKMVRPKLYEYLMDKFTAEYLAVQERKSKCLE
jgi:hypothetical protein